MVSGAQDSHWNSRFPAQAASPKKLALSATSCFVFPIEEERGEGSSNKHPWRPRDGVQAGRGQRRKQRESSSCWSPSTPAASTSSNSNSKPSSPTTPNSIHLPATTPVYQRKVAPFQLFLSGWRLFLIPSSVCIGQCRVMGRRGRRPMVEMPWRRPRRACVGYVKSSAASFMAGGLRVHSIRRENKASQKIITSFLTLLMGDYCADCVSIILTACKE